MQSTSIRIIFVLFVTFIARVAVLVHVFFFLTQFFFFTNYFELILFIRVARIKVMDSLEEINIIKGILNTRCKDGATVEDIKGIIHLTMYIANNIVLIVHENSVHLKTIFNFIFEDDFTAFIGTPWQMANKTFDNIKNYMESIDGVFCIESHAGPIKWFIHSKETVHIRKMIQEQRRSSECSPKSRKFVSKQFLNKTIDAKECFFKDNYVYKYKR